jgi:CspA family cold shock protein
LLADERPKGFPDAAAETRIGWRDGRVTVSALCAEGAVVATGTVKFFNAQKGFGFIQQTGGGPDVFVHDSAVERAGMSGLAEGQKLSFDIVTERGKSAAANLQAE